MLTRHSGFCDRAIAEGCLALEIEARQLFS